MLAAWRALRAVLVAAALLTAGGCATVTRGITQDIQVATDPAGARCDPGGHPEGLAQSD